MKTKLKKSLFIILFILLVIVVIFFVFVSFDYEAQDVEFAFKSSDTVTVSKENSYWFFDGQGTTEAFVFYPGALVDPMSYGPLLRALAEKGYDAFLVKMPFNMAFFGINSIEKIKEKYSYESWYIIGHSLGGTAGEYYISKNPDSVKGFVLLGAFLTKDLSATDVKVLSIYGTEDMVLTRSLYEKGLSLMPSIWKEFVIEGGNHSGFGSYGHQKGDGISTITKEEQWEITVKQIVEFF